MKRVLILTLALMLLTSSALAVGFDTSKGYPVVEEPVTFNILAKQHMFHVNWDEMDLWKDYEAMTGVHIDWTLVTSESFDEKRNLLMAANELPDAIMIANLTNEQLIQYGEDGLLVDFSGLLEYMPNLSAAMEKYPQYEGVDTCEEVGYYYAKINLLDDFFAQLIDELDQADLLENTVIVGVTDHYSYSMKDQERVLELSDVPVELMVEKTPCFIWSADMEQPVTVDKTCNTSDILPTLLNLFGMETDYRYIGQDVFNPNYDGYVIFSDGNWITNEVVYENGSITHTFYDDAEANVDINAMNELAQRYIETSNLILESDYYAQ